jgi:YVTN family beta-propeller protein
MKPSSARHRPARCSSTASYLRLAAIFAAALLPLSGCGESASTAPSTAPEDPRPGHLVYVTNETSGDLSIINSATNTVVDTVPLGKRPRGVRVSEDGRTLFIALSGSPMSPPGVDESTLPPADKSADGIGVFDLATRRLVSVFRGVSDPEQLAVGPGGRLYVASEDTGTAVVMDSDTGQAIAQMPVGGEPEGVGISPDRRHVYMTSEEDHKVSVIDTAQNKVVAQIPVGKRPRDAAFSPDGSRAYVPGELDSSLTVIDAVNHRVLNRVTIPGTGLLPMGVVVSPDGERVYVTTGRGRQVVALDAESLKPLGSAEVGTRPWGLGISPDGRWLYTANGPSNDVSVVDAQQMKVVSTVKVGERPWGVAIVESPPR